MNRLKWIDIAKGIGIITVVLGHSISPVMSGNIVLDNIYSLIYVFHMPLFFFLAGYLQKCGGGVQQCLKKI